MEGGINVVGSEVGEIKLFEEGVGVILTFVAVIVVWKVLIQILVVLRMILQPRLLPLMNVGMQQIRTSTSFARPRKDKTRVSDVTLPGISPDLEDCTTRLSTRYNQLLSLSRAMLVCSLQEGKSSP